MGLTTSPALLQVKCTGEKTGCSKCRTNEIECVYPLTSERGAQARRQSANKHNRNGDRDNHTSNPSSSSRKVKEERAPATPPTLHGTDRDSRPASSANSPVATPPRHDLDMLDGNHSPLHSPYTSTMSLAPHDTLTSHPTTLPFDLGTDDLGLDLTDHFNYGMLICNTQKKREKRERKHRPPNQKPLTRST